MDIATINLRVVLDKDAEETAAEYWDVLNSALKNITLPNSFRPTISQIEKVIQPSAQKGFYQSGVKAQDGTRTISLFISASKEQIEQIFTTGFPTTIGNGIYLPAEFTTSNTIVNQGSGHYAMICEVLTGRSKQVKSLTGLNKLNSAELRKQNFDSVFLPPGLRSGGDVSDSDSGTNIINRGKGYVIFDRRQVLLKYVIQYHRVSVSLTALATPTTPGIKRKMLRASRVYDESSSDDAHYRVVESQFLSLCIKQGLYPSLESVELILNTDLIRKWNNKKEEFELHGKGEVILGFHATPMKEYIENIITNNFDPARIGSTSDCGWWGRGFYFSEFPNISLAYGSHLLLCKLLIGRAYDVTHRMDGQPLIEGYDSHRLGTEIEGLLVPNGEGRGQELVIPHPDQILPLYILYVGGVGRR